MPEDGPPPLPDGVDREEIQRPEDGAGPLFHRTYRVEIRDARTAPEELMATIQGDPDEVAPREFTTFQKTKGDEGSMRVGDEFTVRMPGPWDGPVRAIEVGPTSFGFVTLDGHLEAGRIRFSASDLGSNALELRIETWARAGDRLSNVLFDHIPVNKEVQLHMWTSVLARLVALSGGRRDGRVEITTRRVDEAQLAGAG